MASGTKALGFSSAYGGTEVPPFQFSPTASHVLQEKQIPRFARDDIRIVACAKCRAALSASRRCGGGALGLWSLWRRWACRLLHPRYLRASLVFLLAGVLRRRSLACRCRERDPCCAAALPKTARGDGAFPGAVKRRRLARGDGISRRVRRTSRFP